MSELANVIAQGWAEADRANPAPTLDLFTRVAQHVGMSGGQEARDVLRAAAHVGDRARTPASSTKPSSSARSSGLPASSSLS